MAVAVEVKAHYDSIVKAKRERLTQRVLQAFSTKLPDLKRLAFFDDEDSLWLKHEFGAANRGCFAPVKGSRPSEIWPPAMADLLFVDVDDCWLLKRAFDEEFTFMEAPVPTKPL